MRKCIHVCIVFLCLCSLVLAEGLTWAQFSSPTTPVLDNPVDPLYTIDLGYVADSNLRGYGDTALLELDIRWRDLAYFRDILSGDVDLDFIFDLGIFLGSADIQLPDQTARIAFDVGWTWRYVNGNAFQLRFAPGIYSDIEEISSDVFFYPVSLKYVKSFGSDLGGEIGVQIRPDFERVFYPLIGIDWDMHDNARLSLKLPESRLLVRVNRNWSAHAGFEWSNISYALREKGSYDRALFTYEDFRYNFGVTYKMSDQLQVTGLVGQSFERSIEFGEDDGGIERDIEIERADYVSIGIGGPF